MIYPRYDEVYAPDGVTLIEQTIDNGDGTGVKTVYTDGDPIVTELSGLPVADTEYSEEAALLDAAETARRAAYDEVMNAGTRSMVRLELADKAGSDAFRAVLAAAANQ